MGKWLDMLNNTKPEVSTPKNIFNIDIDLCNRRLEDKGYVKIYSDIIGEELYLAKDYYEAQKLENKFKSDNKSKPLVIFTLNEVSILKGGKEISNDSLKQIHTVKNIFGSLCGRLYQND